MGRLWRPAPQKVDPPGGTTGRVGSARGWMRRPCWTQIHEKRFRAKWSAGSREEKRVKQEEAFSGSEVAFSKKDASQTATKSAAEISNRRYARGPCNCRRRRTGEPNRSGDSRRSSNRR